MGGPSKISEDLEAIEAKKKSFTKSVLSVLVQWKDFECHFDLTQKEFGESFRELEARDKDLCSLQESLDSARQWLELREKDFLLFCEKKKLFLESKEKKLISIGENCAKEVEEKLKEQEQRVQGHLAKLEFERREMEAIKGFVQKRFMEVELREKHFEDQRKEIELIRDSLEKKAQELEHNVGKLKEREKKVEHKEEEVNIRKERDKEVEFKIKDLDLMIENIEEKEKQINFIRNLNEKRLKELDINEKQLQKRRVELMKEKEMEIKLLEKQCQELESRKKEFEVRVRDFEWKEKKHEESLKDFDLKKREFKLKEELLKQEEKGLDSRKKVYEDSMKKHATHEKELQMKMMQLKNVVQHQGIPEFRSCLGHGMRGAFPHPKRVMEFESPIKKQKRFMM
ncbi:hypothetical protein M9H77_07315 [Catharanthus roseus]|uniref:Uncharacterized protein n=1 Tax=Catharanthus roseus TaxID=4058 RepID=A0ACC0BUR3_CATRO|nr:hypothetical protein M9H77_07315 [Catharanthus roseus]